MENPRTKDKGSNHVRGSSRAATVKGALIRSGGIDDMAGAEARGDSPKMMTATSTEQRTPSSYAFLKRPFLRCGLCMRQDGCRALIDRVLSECQEN